MTATLDLAAVLARGILTAADLERANRAGVAFTDVNLAGADLAGAKLNGADLSGADLRRSDLGGGADLGGADLGGADLEGADLTDAYLGYADLTDADLTDADLTDADLEGADLTRTDLTGAVLPDSLTPDQARARGAMIGEGERVEQSWVTATLTSDQRQAVMDVIAAIGADPSGMELARQRFRPSDLPDVQARLQVWVEGLSSSERSAHLGRYARGKLPSGTSYAQERERARMALDWVARRHMPAWMDLIPELAEHAAALRALPPIDSDDAWSQVLPTCEAVPRDVWQPSGPRRGPDPPLRPTPVMPSRALLGRPRGDLEALVFKLQESAHERLALMIGVVE